MPMGTRTAGASHPRSREYRRKKMAASTSAMPATAENSLTPTSCSQSNALSKEVGPDVRLPDMPGDIGATSRGSILGGASGGNGGFSGAFGVGGTAAVGGVTGGDVTAGREIGGGGAGGGGGGVTDSRAANGGGGGPAIGDAAATASLFSC